MRGRKSPTNGTFSATNGYILRTNGHQKLDNRSKILNFGRYFKNIWA